MCGIIAVFSKKNKSAGQYAFELYKKQEARGRRGYGYISISDGKIVNVVRTKTESEIKSHIMKEKADTILFHHRMPTSTENSVGTTHPMFVSNPELECDYYLAHNGTLSKPDVLKAEHEKLGYEYLTEHTVTEFAEFKDSSKNEMVGVPEVKFNDSEVLAIEFARYMEGLTSEIRAEGAMAFWAVSVEKGTNNVVGIFYGRNHGRTLCEQNTKKWKIVSSENGTDVRPMLLYTVNPVTLSTTEAKLPIDYATPVVTQRIGYNTSGYYDSRTRTYSYDDKAYSYESSLPPPLENRKYTAEEIRRLGHSFPDFISSWLGGALYYTPRKFSEPKITIVEEPKTASNLTEKQERRLEELSFEYARAMLKADEVEQMLSDGSIDYNTYTKLYNEYYAESSMAYDLLYSLGVPEEDVEFYVEYAMESEEQSKAYKTSIITEE